jgi:hypothetical protein
LAECFQKIYTEKIAKIIPKIRAEDVGGVTGLGGFEKTGE